MSARPFGYVRDFRPPARRGPDAVWFILLFCVATFSTFVTGGVMLVRRGDRATADNNTTARFDVRTIHPVAEKYAAEHPGICPSVDGLVRERELSAATTTSDPWQTPYRVECRPTAPHTDGTLTVVVRSAGPDRRFDTGDDLSSRD